MNSNKKIVLYKISFTLLALITASAFKIYEDTRIVDHEPDAAYAVPAAEQLSLSKTGLLNQNFDSIKIQYVSSNTNLAVAENNMVLPVAPQIDEKSVQTTHIYFVTAFMLNVREKGTSQSNILTVLKQNDSIEVIGDFDADWLELQQGGFVRSSYVTQAANEEALPKSSAQELKIAKNSIITAELNEVRILAAPETKNDSAIISKEKLNHVNIKSNLSASDIETMLQGTDLEGKQLGTVIIEVEHTYGINAIFTVAVAKLESGNGRSRISKDKNNLFGLNATDGNEYHGALKFDSQGDSVKAFGRIISDYYLDQGLTTIAKINKKYCPANPDWTSLVSTIMKGDYNKVT